MQGDEWTTDAVTSSGNMFTNCTSIRGGKGTTYDASHVNKDYAHIDGGTANPGYFTEKGPEAYACYTPSNTTLTFYYDTQRSSRSGTTYDLNTGSSYPAWYNDGTYINVTKVVFAPSFAGARPTTTSNWFRNMQHLTSITGMKEYLNTSEVINMREMFYYCRILTSLDLSSFNTANVTNMSYMFYNCYSLTSLDLSSFNTANVTYMSYMFTASYGLRTIYVGNRWSTSAVTNSTEMFYDCTSLVGGMGTTYNSSHRDKEYAHIDGGPSNPGYLTDPNVQTAYACYTPSNTTLTFYYDNQRYSRTGTTYDLNTESNNPGWRTDGTYANITKVVFNPSFANARPTTTYRWFYNMTNLTNITGISYLKTNEVTNMTQMFDGCSSLTSIDLSTFNTAKVTRMYSMFHDCSSLTSLNLSNFNTYQVTIMALMFDGCTKLTSLNLSNFNTSNVTNMEDMFYGCSSLTSLNLSSFNTANVANMKGMFNGCSSLNSLNLSSFNTSNVYSMSYMFNECFSLNSLNLSNFNTSNVTEMYRMFYNCIGLTSLDLSSFNTSKVTSMSYMFYACTNLTTIYVGPEWSTASINSYGNGLNMFFTCPSLVGGMGTAYDINHVDYDYAHIDGGPSNPGYFTDKNAYQRGDVDNNGEVKIGDVTALINYLLSGDASAINLQAADCDQNGEIKIGDVTALINYLLSGSW